MSDAREKLEGMSAQKRALVEAMLRKRNAIDTETSPRAMAESVVASELEYQEAVSANETRAFTQRTENDSHKSGIQRDYDAYHENCNSTVFGKHSFFMNLGYAVDGSKTFSPIELSARVPNAHSIKLALETIGDWSLSARRVLDVGCGRGGIVYVIRQYFSPASVVGVDLSPAGIEFCRRTHRYDNVEFQVEDAENLSFPDGTFDAVTNVESSHCYPNRERFYKEVERVLRPGGVFLYSDVLTPDEFELPRQVFGELHASLDHERDISANVLRSCDDTASAQYAAFAREENGKDDWMAYALGLPGSAIYNDMQSGAKQFRCMRFRKS